MTTDSSNTSFGNSPEPTKTIHQAEVQTINKWPVMQFIDVHAATKTHHIENINLRIDVDKITGVFGAQNSGHRLIYDIISGQRKTTDGQIAFFDSPFRSKHIKQIAQIPKDICSPSQMSLKRFFSIYKQFFDHNPDDFSKHLEILNLEAPNKKMLATLEPGTLHLYLIAFCLSTSAKLIVLDQTFSTLDSKQAQQIYNLIKSLKRKKTLLILENHIAPAHKICDAIYVLNQGRVVLTPPNHQEYFEHNFGKPQKLSGDGSTRYEDSPSIQMHRLHEHLRYHVEISGVTEVELKQLGENHSLLPWQELFTEGYTTTIGFAEYRDAAIWLYTCLNSGMVVTHFSHSESLQESELQVYLSMELQS